jgi:hypothetical protein
MTRTRSDAVDAIGDLTDATPLYLRRLRRMLTLRYQAARFLSEADRHLLDRGILSAYLACRSAGLEAEAGRILEIARRRADRELGVQAERSSSP